MMLEIRWHGRAGQGAKTVSQMLALALIDAGRWVQAFPEYGPERSGSPMRAYNRSADAPIRRRDPITTPDAVVVLDPSLLAEVDVAAGLRPRGVLVVNSDAPPSDVRHRLAFAGRLACIPGDRIAASAGAGQANIVLLGALAAVLGEPSLDALGGTLRASLGGKLGPSEMQAAHTCLAAGHAAGLASRAQRDLDRLAPTTRTSERAAAGTFRELPAGAMVIAAGAERLRTGSWRGGMKPQVVASRCVNCLLCWVYCPDCAIRLEHARLEGFDYALCKGCELCVEVCPTGAISMVEESRVLPVHGLVPE